MHGAGSAVGLSDKRRLCFLH